jgi:hypothetical protein
MTEGAFKPGAKITGTIVKVEGRHFLEYEDEKKKKVKQPLDSFVPESKLTKLSDKKVDVILSEPKSFPIAISSEGLTPWICYVPTVDLFKAVTNETVVGPEILSIPMVQSRLAKQYRDAGIIPENIYEKVSK